jgi:hypothetical protein
MPRLDNIGVRIECSSHLITEQPASYPIPFMVKPIGVRTLVFMMDTPYRTAPGYGRAKLLRIEVNVTHVTHCVRESQRLTIIDPGT